MTESRSISWRAARGKQKKADVVEHHGRFDHVGLLVNRPLGIHRGAVHLVIRHLRCKHSWTWSCILIVWLGTRKTSAMFRINVPFLAIMNYWSRILHRVQPVPREELETAMKSRLCEEAAANKCPLRSSKSRGIATGGRLRYRRARESRGARTGLPASRQRTRTQYDITFTSS